MKVTVRFSRSIMQPNCLSFQNRFQLCCPLFLPFFNKCADKLITATDDKFVLWCP